MSKSKIEILCSMLKGEKISPIPPFAMWRHFPRDDLKAELLAKKQLNYLKKFDSIFMKVSPNGRYCVIDWGCNIAFNDKQLSGSAYCTDYRIKSMNDWDSLEELDVNQGMFGEQLKALKLINNGIKDGTPFMETVFNPLMIAAKLTAQKDTIMNSMIENPKVFHEGLKTITKVMIEFAKASLDYGAAGIFLATQEATYDLLDETKFKEFGMKYDLELLNAIKGKAEFNIMHIHGENIMFDLIANNYPIQAINWHDQLTPPTIKNAQKKFGGITIGGIEEKENLFKATAQNIAEKIIEIITSVNCSRFIVAPGCVIPINVPDGKITEILELYRKYKKHL